MALRLAPVLWNTHVRLYECDINRHLNNVVYLDYIGEATFEAWGGIGDADWKAARLSMEYRAPAFKGDRLLVSGWPMGNDPEDPGLLRCGYAIRKNNEAEPILRVEIDWRLSASQTGAPFLLTEPWPEAARDEADYLLPDRRVGEPRDGRWYRWEHIVRTHEVDAGGSMSASELLRCVEDARVFAFVEAGWNEQRLAGEDFLTVQIRHEARFQKFPHMGDRLQVKSRICELGRLRGTWEHRVECGGKELAVDFSTGAFLDRRGVPSRPPARLMNDLISGPAQTLSPK